MTVDNCAKEAYSIAVARQ